MTALAGATALVTGGAGTIGSTLVDQLFDAGAAQVRVLDNFVRGREANLGDALARDGADLVLVRGDIRDRDLVHDLTSGCDVVFHQAAIRITQCAEEPRLALEVLEAASRRLAERPETSYDAAVPVPAGPPPVPRQAGAAVAGNVSEPVMEGVR